MARWCVPFFYTCFVIEKEFLRSKTGSPANFVKTASFELKYNGKLFLERDTCYARYTFAGSKPTISGKNHGGGSNA
jgi:hypothetical protein